MAVRRHSPDQSDAFPRSGPKQIVVSDHRPWRNRPVRIVDSRSGRAGAALTMAVVGALACLPGCRPAPPVIEPAAEDYELVFSTYLGGGQWEHARDVCVDRDGNVYMVGGTASDDFPTTTQAFDRTFNDGGQDTGKAGQCDAFVSKFDPTGRLVWSTYLGGPNYDRAYAVEVDAEGSVHVAGRAGPGFPVTPAAFQSTYAGSRYNNAYGSQNGFAAKLSADGSQLIWASYVGVGELCRDLDIDDDGNVYVPLGWNPFSRNVTRPGWLDAAMSRAYRKQPSGRYDCGVVKIRGDGQQVLWATWLGGSGKETQEASLRVDSQQRVYIICDTMSPDAPTTPGAHSRELHGRQDGYVACLSADGSELVFGTYLGGSGDEWLINTHNLALDAMGNAYVSVGTKSEDFPTTPGVYRREHSGKIDIAIAKLSPRGELLCSTFLGGRGNDNSDGIHVDADGNIFFVGSTSSTDFPVTANAFQLAHGGDQDAVVVRLAADMSRLLYSTFMGGTAYDNGRSAFWGSSGDLYVTGAANGPGWPRKNAYQNQFAGGGGGWGNGDCVLARFQKR
jgi:hypothetical protein